MLWKSWQKTQQEICSVIKYDLGKKMFYGYSEVLRTAFLEHSQAAASKKFYVNGTYIGDIGDIA